LDAVATVDGFALYRTQHVEIRAGARRRVFDAMIAP
jgi:hypothetical protein